MSCEPVFRKLFSRQALMDLAQDLPSVGNALTTSVGTKHCLIHTLIEEVVIDQGDEGAVTLTG